MIGHGYTTVPTLLLQHQAELGISCLELAVLLHILQHWWKADQLPFPSNGRLATLLGISARQVQRHIAALEGKNLIERIARKSGSGGRTTNLLDPGRLVARLTELARRLPSQAKKGKKTTEVG